MSEYLIDTSVLSALASDRPRPQPTFTAWLGAQADRLWISVVTLAEIERGVWLLRDAASHRKAQVLSDWLDATLADFASFVLDVTPAVARAAGQLGARAKTIGRDPGFADILIAATARTHGLTVLTRNLRHFEPLGVAVADPFVQLP